jgi:hypothetical protein
MATLAKPAYGFQLWMSDSAGANHVKIAEVQDSDLDFTTRSADGTAHSTDEPWEVIVPTIKSNTVNFKVNWVPNNSTHDSTTGIMYVYIQGEERNFKCVDPHLGDLMAFDGFVMGFKGQYPVAGLKNASVTIKGKKPTLYI